MMLHTGRRDGGSKRKCSLIKDDMTRNNYSTSSKIQTPITTMVCWIPEKDTSRRTRRELVESGGKKIGVTQTTKHSKMIIRSWFLKKASERDLIVNSGGRKKIEKMSSHV